MISSIDGIMESATHLGKRADEASNSAPLEPLDLNRLFAKMPQSQ
jgi:hypothetical protein